MADFYEKGKFLRAVEPYEVGLPSGSDHHQIVSSDSPNSWGSVTFTCTCGYTVPIRANRSGKAVKATRLRWDNHVEAMDHDPDIIYECGTVTLVSKHTTRRIFVVARSYRQVDTYVDGGYNYWTKSTYNGEHHWGVLADGDGSRVVLETALTREAALTAALRVLDMAQKRGSRVFRQVDAFNLPGSDTIRTVTASLLGLSEDAEMEELGNALVALDALLALVPHLEQKQVRLSEERERRLRAPWERVAW